jgi:PAS domain S-box-containing protein
MKSSSPGSLRVRLVSVVILAVIPSLALIYYNAREQRREAVSQATEDVARIARLSAATYGGVIEGARQLLVALAQTPEVVSGDESRCGTALARLLKKNESYFNLGVAAPDGTVQCSAIPLNEHMSIADTPWFKNALMMRIFTVGGYQVSRFVGKPSLAFGYPIIANGDQVQGIVFASLDLDYLNRPMAVMLAPEGVQLALVDRDGVILAHTPTGENLVGKLAPDAEVLKKVSSYNGRGTDLGPDASGVERIYAYYPIGGRRGADAYVTASVPAAVALANADRQLNRNLIGLGIVALLALAAAWYGGEAIVLRHTNDELEQRVQARTRELAHEQFLLRTLLDNIPDSIYFKDTKGRFLRSSKAQAQRFGLSDPAEAIGKTDFDFFKKEHAEEAFADEQQIIQTGRPLIGIEENSPLADGTERWVSTSKLPLRDKEGGIVGTFGISREITERIHAEQLLAKERTLLRTLVDNLPDLVSVKDLKGRYAFDNAAHRTILGVSNLDDVVGKTVFDFYPKEVAERLHTDDEAVLSAAVPVLRREEDLTDRKGRKTRAITSKIPYRDEQRKVVGLVCISHLLGELK